MTPLDDLIATTRGQILIRVGTDRPSVISTNEELKEALAVNDDVDALLRKFMKEVGELNKPCPECKGELGFGDHMGWMWCEACKGTGRANR